MVTRELNILKSPIKLGFIITFIGTLLLLSATALQSIFSVNVPSFFIPTIYLISIFLIGCSYKQKYNEKLPKDLILKIALFSSVFIIPLFLILSIVLIAYNHAPVAIFFALLGIIAFFVNFGVVYLNLNFSNVISIGNAVKSTLNNIKLPKALTLALENDEVIVLNPKNRTFKALLFTLIICILLIAFWYFMGNEIFMKLGTLSIVITIGVFAFAFIDTIDTFLFSKFILTNRRIVKRRYLIYSEILLSEVELLNSTQTLDFGTVSVIQKNGCTFNSPMIANPKKVKAEIEKYIQTLEL